jgi:hypothetical protein
VRGNDHSDDREQRGRVKARQVGDEVLRIERRGREERAIDIVAMRVQRALPNKGRGLEH